MGDFRTRTLRGVNKAVCRLGLAFNHGLDANGVAAALDRGVNYLFLTNTRTGAARPVVREALRKDRERQVVCVGPTLGITGFSVRRSAEGWLRELGTDYLDVFQLYWLGRTSGLTAGVVDALLKLKAEGKVRALGVSIHDRVRAGRLAEESVLDLFMVRYNAAHPGAERDIFPHLARRHPNVVAYTATRWGRLLRAPRGWSGKVMTPTDCYRFCLSSPHVDLVLTAPETLLQLEENLMALDRGPLSPDEEAWMREFGAAVHG